MNGRRLAVSSMLILSVVSAAPAAADPISITERVTWSENGHQYAVVPAEFVTWEEASLAVTGMFGPRWYLATITSAQEQNFISSLALPGVEYWLGGFQPPLMVPPDAEWTWVTNEPFVYRNWAPFEPNDIAGPASEQHLAMWGEMASLTFPRPRGTWNDEYYRLDISGYVAETSNPIPEPGTLLLVVTGIVGCASRRDRRNRAQRSDRRRVLATG
jgi:hypothetical protein